MIKWFRRKLICQLTKHLFHPITAEDVLGFGINEKTLKPIIKFKERELDTDQIQLLKQNAENFESSLLWKLMENRIRLVSQEKMFPLSSVDNDLMFGKAMLYELDVIKTVIKEIKNIKL